MCIGGKSNRKYSLSTEVDVSIIQQFTEESDLSVTFNTADLNFPITSIMNIMQFLKCQK